MSTLHRRSRSGDMFYNPPPVLRQVQQWLLQKHEQQIPRAKILTDSDDCASTLAATTPPDSSSPYTAFVGGGNLSNLTNLDRFLKCTTPVVPTQRFSKVSKRGWSTREYDFRPYFVLGDLWESFHEWSAYGAGVPFLSNGSDCVMQYYVPYLSGIQLYIDPSMPAPRNRGMQIQRDLVEDSRQRIRGLSISNKTSNFSSCDEGEFVSPPGVLTFEYLEHDPPFSREPLTTKMSLLASRFPELNTYRSCDLSPASWICVAWYPIYRIPTCSTLKNLDSSFLTFHSLSTPIRGMQNEGQCPYGSQPREVPRALKMALKLSLPTFGLASYKFNTAFWEHTEADGYPKANSLLQAADDWLELLNVCLPDHTFFTSRNPVLS